MQSLDAEVGALLGSATVPVVTGGFDAMHVSNAITALCRQSVEGLWINRSLPVIVAGENRRVAAHLAPPVPTAAGDLSGQIGGVIVSPDVPADLLCLVSVDFRPAVIGVLAGNNLEAPPVRLGRGAGGIEDVNRAGADLMAAIDVCRSAPALVVQGGVALGAVRLEMV